MGDTEVGTRYKCSGGVQDSDVVRSAVCGNHSDGIVAVAVAGVVVVAYVVDVVAVVVHAV